MVFLLWVTIKKIEIGPSKYDNHYSLLSNGVVNGLLQLPIFYNFYNRQVTQLNFLVKVLKDTWIIYFFD